MEDPELKISNVIIVMLSGGRERPFWKPWLGTCCPLTGALWAKSIQRCRSYGGSRILLHLFLLSSAMDRPRYRMVVDLEDISNRCICTIMVSNTQGELFRIRVSKLWILIFSFQEAQDTSRSNFRTIEYSSGLKLGSMYSVSSLHERKDLDIVEEKILVTYHHDEDILGHLMSIKYSTGRRSCCCSFTVSLLQGRKVLNNYKEDKNLMNHNVVIFHRRRRQSECGSLILFKEDKLKGESSKDDLYWLVRMMVLTIKLFSVHILLDTLLRLGSVWLVGGGKLSCEQIPGNLLVAERISQLADELQKIRAIKDHMEHVPHIDLHYVEMFAINLGSVDEARLTELLERVSHVTVLLGLVPPDVQASPSREVLQTGVEQVKVWTSRVGMNEPLTITFKIIKYFDGSDLLDHNWRPSVLILAADRGHIHGRHVQVEGAGDHRQEGVDEFFSRFFPRDSSTTKDQRSENVVLASNPLLYYKVKDSKNRKFFLPNGLLSFESEELSVRVLLDGLDGSEGLVNGWRRHDGQKLTVIWAPHTKVINSFAVWKAFKINIYMETGYENNTVRKFIYRLAATRDRKKKEGQQHGDIFDRIMIFVALDK